MSGGDFDPLESIRSRALIAILEVREVLGAAGLSAEAKPYIEGLIVVVQGGQNKRLRNAPSSTRG